MKSPRALRVYRTQVQPGPLAMGAINELSFQCWNMADNGPSGGIYKLAKDLSDGTRVTVMRVSGLAGELHAMEFVTVEGGELLEIILSSAVNESFVIPFTLPSCKIGTGVQKAGIPATFFKDTYVEPSYDLYAETCPFLYTLDHKSFIAVVHGGPVYQAVSKNRDDWHNNQYQNNADLGIGQHFLTYYETITRRYVSEVHVGFSFSPYTRNLGLSHIGRYIDHARRLYIPILGRGTAFETASPKISGCEDFPFGKKPFTRSAGGFSSYREVVRAAGGLPSPDVLNFNMRLLWPFIPYIHEIPYLTLQYQNLGSLSNPVSRLSLQDIGPLSSYELRYNTDEATVITEPIRTDTAAGTFPAVASSETETTDIDPAGGVVSGESSSLSSQGNTQTYTLNKSAPVGTVGDKQDLHVETALSGVIVYDYQVAGSLTRESNFPGTYYMPEFVDDLFWPCGRMEDETNAGQDTNVRFTNTVTGSQELKVGDLVLDSGNISMVYTGAETGTITHNGTASRFLACPPPADIGYTTQQMGGGESQGFTCLDESGDPVSCSDAGCLWTVISGGGTINPVTGVYTAPTTNPECANNPVIGLVCGGTLLFSVEIAVSTGGAATGAGTIKEWLCEPNVPPSTYWTLCQTHSQTSAYQPYNFGACCQTGFNCDGTLAATNGWTIGAWSTGPSGTWCAAVAAGCVAGITDSRSAAQKTAGCCPYQLL